MNHSTSNFNYAWDEACYLGSGLLLQKIGIRKVAAWIFAAVLVGLNLPRHFKTFHHYDHINQHWLYISILLDVWIWKGFTERREISMRNEFWRVFCLFGIFGTYGYFWIVAILEWVLLRVFLAVQGKRGGVRWVDTARKSLSLPAAGILVLGTLDMIWFIPLMIEAHRLGSVQQGMGWFASRRSILQPMWVTGLLHRSEWLQDLLPGVVAKFRHIVSSYDETETLTAPGWTYLLALGFGFFALIKQRGRKAWGRIAPFLLFFLFCYFYINDRFYTLGLHPFVQAIFPLMKFFRVASRMGLFFPILIGALVALMWEDMDKTLRGFWNSGKKVVRIALLACGLGYAAILVLEASLLSFPVTAGPKLGPGLAAFMSDLKRAPGTTVLDMPFCVAGGNGVCTEQQCAMNPNSAMPQLLTLWHDKKVYGTYQARLVPSECEIYGRAPYLSWFDAWKQKRCLTPPEWDGLCDYLGAHTELAALLVYPELWGGSDTPACRAEFKRRLGGPIATTEAFSRADRSQKGFDPTRILRYAPRCLSSAVKP